MDNVLLSRIRQEAYEAGYNDGLTEGYNLVAKKIVPTADVPDRKVGEWIYYPKASGAVTSTAVYFYPICSVCGCEHPVANYCPNCGARMKGEKSDLG